MARGVRLRAGMSIVVVTACLLRDTWPFTVNLSHLSALCTILKANRRRRRRPASNGVDSQQGHDALDQ